MGNILILEIFDLDTEQYLPTFLKKNNYDPPTTSHNPSHHLSSRVFVGGVLIKSNMNNPDPFHHTTLTDRIADIIGIILAIIYTILTVLIIISAITIIGVETASAIWGDYEVVYWLANLF